MHLKTKAKNIIWLFPLAVLIAAGIVFSGKNYNLNKTVREITLRLIQIRRLSRTRAVDYRLEFHAKYFSIDYFDAAESRWKKYSQSRYRHRIKCELDGATLILSKGRLQKFGLKGQKELFPEYMIVYFVSQKSKKRKALIFYKKGNWKVIF
jgi:hypothetical protein